MIRIFLSVGSNNLGATQEETSQLASQNRIIGGNRPYHDVHHANANPLRLSEPDNPLQRIPNVRLLKNPV